MRIRIRNTALLGQPLLCNSTVFAEFFTEGDKRLEVEALGGGGEGVEGGHQQQQPRVDLDSLGLTAGPAIRSISNNHLGITVSHDLRYVSRLTD
jgi:hypothetical protein